MNISLKLRIDEETERKIKFCMEKLNTTRSDILRKGVHKIYEELKDK